MVLQPAAGPGPSDSHRKGAESPVDWRLRARNRNPAAQPRCRWNRCRRRPRRRRARRRRAARTRRSPRQALRRLFGPRALPRCNAPRPDVSAWPRAVRAARLAHVEPVAPLVRNQRARLRRWQLLTRGGRRPQCSYSGRCALSLCLTLALSLSLSLPVSRSSSRLCLVTLCSDESVASQQQQQPQQQPPQQQPPQQQQVQRQLVEQESRRRATAAEQEREREQSWLAATEERLYAREEAVGAKLAACDDQWARLQRRQEEVAQAESRVVQREAAVQTVRARASLDCAPHFTALCLVV
jgi:hypothetical protein